MPNWNSKIYRLIDQLECIKCGSREPHLMPYALSHSKLINIETKRKYSISTYNVHSIPVPTCLQCKKRFDSWGLTKTLFTLLIIFGFFPFWLGLFPLIFNIGDEPMYLYMLGISIHPRNLQIITVSIGVIILAIGISLFFLHKKKDTNPSKYMKMGPDLVPLVKPKNNLYWVKYEDWVRSLTNEQIIPTAILKPEEGKQKDYRKPDIIPRFEKMIFNYLMENRGKAFTARAITNRIIEKLDEESDKEFLKINAERILNRLGIKKHIIVVQRDEEFYYSVN